MKHRQKISVIFLATLLIGIFHALINTTLIQGKGLQEAINVAMPGDTLFISDGVYPAIYIKDKQNSRQFPLVIKPEKGASVTIKGAEICKGKTVSVQNCSFLLIEGITVESGMFGIYVEGCNHLIIRNNEVKNTGQEGIRIKDKSHHVDIIKNHVHHTGLYHSKYGEGIYLGTGNYSETAFPDNTEYIWVEKNRIHDCGNGEGINVKGECFHVTLLENTIYNIAPGTKDQYNQAAITVEGPYISLKNQYRLNEKRDVWVVNNQISYVDKGFSDWNNGIMFGGSGCYILHNKIKCCKNRPLFGNEYGNLGLEAYVRHNAIAKCGQKNEFSSEIRIMEADPPVNPNIQQDWANKSSLSKGTENPSHYHQQQSKI